MTTKHTKTFICSKHLDEAIIDLTARLKKKYGKKTSESMIIQAALYAFFTQHDDGCDQDTLDRYLASEGLRAPVICKIAEGAFNEM